MDNFNNIIKEKVEHFDVPFNDAHWAEMEGKLNAIRSKKVKGLLFGSAVVITTIVIISSYILFSSNPIKKSNAAVKVSAEKTIQENNASNQKSTTALPTTSDKNITTKVKPTEESLTVFAKKEVSIKKVVKAIPVQTKVTAPVIISTKQEPKTSEVTVANRITVAQKKIEAEQLSPKLTQERVPKKSIENTASKPKNKAPITTQKPLNTARIKSIRHRAYEDENVSKKSVKRRRWSWGIFNFKRKYKLTVPKKIKSEKNK